MFIQVARLSLWLLRSTTPDFEGVPTQVEVAIDAFTRSYAAAAPAHCRSFRSLPSNAAAAVKNASTSSRTRDSTSRTSLSALNFGRYFRRSDDAIVAFAGSGPLLAVLLHGQQSNEATGDDGAWKRPAIPKDHRVQRVAVRCAGRWHESPVEGIRKAIDERPRQRERVQIGVMLSFTVEPRGDSTTT